MYATSFDKEELIRCAKGELFGVGNAQLPMPPMLMMDRITNVSSALGSNGLGHITAELDLHPDQWFFPCHFPGNPVMPGCLMLDGLWQLVGFNLGWRGWQGKGMAVGCGEVKLTGMVKPDNTLLTYNVDFSRVIDRKLKLGIASGQVEVDGEVVCRVQGMRVGLASENERK